MTVSHNSSDIVHDLYPFAIFITRVQFTTLSLILGWALNLYDIYLIYPDYLLEKMTEEEREAIPTKFKCSLYDDFEIALEDIFNGMLPE